MKEDNTKKDDEREASSIASDHLVCSLELSLQKTGKFSSSIVLERRIHTSK